MTPEALSAAKAERNAALARLGAAEVEQNLDAVPDLEAALEAAERKIKRVEAAIAAAARQTKQVDHALARTEVERAREAAVEAAAKAKALAPKITKAADALVASINELTGILGDSGIELSRALRRHAGDRAIGCQGHMLMPRSLRDALVANILYRVGATDVRPSAFVPDVKALVDQSVARMLNACDRDMRNLPAFRADKEVEHG